jgi:hypothetical protein
MKENFQLHFIIICSIFLNISCNHNYLGIKKEIQLITNDISTTSFFIAVNLSCDGETFPVVITNNSLYKMMWHRGMIHTQEEYSKKIVKSIIRMEPISFDANDKEVLQSYLVIKDDSLRQSLETDKKAFIEKYFVDNKLKSKGLLFAKEKTIIYYLFNNRIYCRRDCISGNIFIVPVTSPI